MSIAKDLPTSEAQRTATINAIINNLDNYEFETDVGNEADLNKNEAKRLESLRSSAIVSEADKEGRDEEHSISCELPLAGWDGYESIQSIFKLDQQTLAHDSLIVTSAASSNQK